MSKATNASPGVLKITRATLELAVIPLDSPMIVVGRAPTCDVVLRAPGVEAVHFLIEWLGTGVFDPSVDRWGITDLSSNASSGVEGLVIKDKAIEIGGFKIERLVNSLTPSSTIGGTIKKELSSELRSPGSRDLAEVIAVRCDSGAIEDIVHLKDKRVRNQPLRALKRFPQFVVRWEGDRNIDPLTVLLSEMPGAEVYRRGQLVNEANACSVTSHEILRIRWKDYDFYVRFVERVNTPPVPRDFMKDKALRLSAIIVLLLMFGIISISVMWPREELPPPEPPRVARIEIKSTAEPEMPAPEVPPAAAQKTVVDLSQNPADSASQKAGDVNGADGAPTARARFSNPSTDKPQAGLNSGAPSGKENRIGILGALKPNKSAGPGVRADMIINDAIVSQTVSGAGDVKVVVKNPPSGTVGSGKGGAQGSGSELSSASTTLKGASDLSSASTGPIASKGGKVGWEAGNVIGGTGKGMKKGSGLSALDAEDFSAEGGLDRETVRRVVNGARGQIRACFDRALLQGGNLSGRIVYDWTIAAIGSVASAEIKSSDISSSALKSCVLGVIRELRFPAAPNKQPTRVIYPFVFQARQ